MWPRRRRRTPSTRSWERAALRGAIGEIATRDCLRRELERRRLVLDDPGRNGGDDSRPKRSMT